eukprot:3398747-Prymnesium_polylepis.1
MLRHKAVPGRYAALRCLWHEIHDDERTNLYMYSVVVVCRPATPGRQVIRSPGRQVARTQVASGRHSGRQWSPAKVASSDVCPLATAGRQQAAVARSPAGRQVASRSPA